MVVAAPEPDALREASFFVERLSGDRMPLSGLVLNRTHPTLSALPSDHALAAADQLAEEEGVDAKARRPFSASTRTGP